MNEITIQLTDYHTDKYMRSGGGIQTTDVKVVYGDQECTVYYPSQNTYKVEQGASIDCFTLLSPFYDQDRLSRYGSKLKESRPNDEKSAFATREKFQNGGYTNIPYEYDENKLRDFSCFVLPKSGEETFILTDEDNNVIKVHFKPMDSNNKEKTTSNNQIVKSQVECKVLYSKAYNVNDETRSAFKKEMDGKKAVDKELQNTKKYVNNTPLFNAVNSFYANSWKESPYQRNEFYTVHHVTITIDPNKFMTSNGNIEISADNLNNDIFVNRPEIAENIWLKSMMASDVPLRNIIPHLEKEKQIYKIIAKGESEKNVETKYHQLDKITFNQNEKEASFLLMNHFDDNRGWKSYYRRELIFLDVKLKK